MGFAGGIITGKPEDFEGELRKFLAKNSHF